jgi:hypothetical protein
MSNNNIKARVELLDETTGEHKSDVDVITSAEQVLYTNETPIANPSPIEDIKPGTTFFNEPISEILDKILYPYTAPSIILNKIVLSNNDLDMNRDLVNDTYIYKEAGIPVESFMLGATVTIGSLGVITPTLIINKEDGTSEVLEGDTIKGEPNSNHLIQFEVPELTITSSLELYISDHHSKIDCPHIIYTFVDPVFCGFTNIESIVDGKIDEEVLIANLESSIENNSKNLEKYIGPKINIQQFIRTDVNYDTKEKLRPALVIPKTWDNVLAIKDLNGNNITKNYIIKTASIQINDNRLIEYIIFVHRDIFYNNEKILSSIIYDFSSNANDSAVLNKYKGKGIPITSEFDVLYNHPLDSRFVVNEYKDLLMMLYPYEGLITYVKDIKTSFKFVDNHWAVCDNKLHLAESTNELTEDFGGWDDVAIISNGGAIYRKRYNNIWELWGNITK